MQFSTALSVGSGTQFLSCWITGEGWRCSGSTAKSGGRRYTWRVSCGSSLASSAATPSSGRGVTAGDCKGCLNRWPGEHLEQSAGPGSAPWQWEEQWSSTCYQPASVTRMETLKCLKTPWTSSYTGFRTSQQCQAWPGRHQPTVCLTNFQYFPFNVLQIVEGPHLGWEPIAVLWGGLLHSSLTPTPSIIHQFISSWGGNP